MKLLFFIFVNFFIMTATAILLAARYLESRKRKQVARMVRVATAEEKISTVNLLKELRASKAANGLLSNEKLAGKLKDLLQQADLSWSGPRFLKTMGVCAGLGLTAGIMFPFLVDRPTTALPLAAMGAALPYLYARKRATKRLEKMEGQLPDAMAFLARSMRAGHAFTISVGMVGDDLPDPLGREFRAMYNEQNLGASLDTAFASFLRRVPLLDARLFCTAAMLQRRTGGNLSEILDRLSDVIRERFRLRGQVKAASAHGRMTAGILTALPVLTTIALVMVAPEYVTGMLKDPDGKKLMFVAVVAQVVGNYVIRKITNIRV